MANLAASCTMSQANSCQKPVGSKAKACCLLRKAFTSFFFVVVVPYLNIKMPPSQTKAAPESLLSLKQQVVPVVAAEQRALSSYGWSVGGGQKADEWLSKLKV